MMQHMLHCWCGNGELTPFTTNYLRCPICETLVVAQAPTLDIAHITDDDHQFYGREYWFSHQEKDLGFTNIIARARADLPERCLHWLRTVLKYKLPPAKALELGSAHGGFVAMLRWAGYDATGMELSPWVVDFAHKTFDVPVLMGPLEDQSIEPASLDLIVLMDVLEHLPDPVTTISHCLRLLKLDGILVIQTPCYPEGKTYDALVSEGNRFLEMLKPDEHLHLFSRHAVRELFHRLNAEFHTFEPAMFADYDMFLVVGQVPFTINTAEEKIECLARTVNGRMVQALLDIDDRRRQMQQKWTEAETDRTARLKALEEQGQQLGSLAAERDSLKAQLADLQQHLEATEADRAARLTVIEEQGQRLGQVEAERNDLRHQLVDLQQHLEATEADRAARLTVIEEQGQRLGQAEAERNDLRHQLVDLQQNFETIELDRAARLKVIEEQAQRLDEVEADIDSLQRQLHSLQSQWLVKALQRLKLISDRVDPSTARSKQDEPSAPPDRQSSTPGR